jgi:hypothetical protein
MRYTQMGVPQVIRATLAAFLLSCPLARADVIADWNAVALNAVTSSEQHPAYAARAMATVHVAMFEVMNFIEGAYVPRYLVRLPEPLGMSSEAAAATAAHHVLAQLHPDRRAVLDAALERSLAAIPDGQEKSSARMAGKSLGANVYAVLASDHPSDGAGIFRTVKTSKIAPVGAPARESVESVVAWNAIAARFIEARNLKPIERARIYALVSMGLRDAYAPAHNAKSGNDSNDPCIPCAAGAAISVILEAHFPPRDGRKVATTVFGTPGAAERLTQVRQSDSVSSARLDGGADYGRSISAGEEMGGKIGLQALGYYRPVGVEQP